jgi:hypothetical protein
MKSLLAVAALAASLSLPHRASAELGSFGPASLKFTRTFQDPAKTKESQSESAFNDSVQNGIATTRVVRLGTTTVRIGNRQILEAMQDQELIADIRGWALGYVAGQGLEGIVAYKAGEPLVPVPAALFTRGGSDYSGGENSVSSYKFEPARSRIVESARESRTSQAIGFSLLETSLVGSLRIADNYRVNILLPDRIESNLTDKVTWRAFLIGSSEAGFLEGTFTRTHLHPVDLAKRFPASENAPD